MSRTLLILLLFFLGTVLDMYSPVRDLAIGEGQRRTGSVFRWSVESTISRRTTDQTSATASVFIQSVTVHCNVQLAVVESAS